MTDPFLPDQPPARRSNSPDVREARLRQRIGLAYQTICEQIQVGPQGAISFTRVADADVVLDQVADAADRLERVSGKRAEGEELHLPYWAELWDSAVGVGRFLASTKMESTNTRMEDGRWMMDEKHLPSALFPFSILHPPSSSSSAPPPTLLDLGCGMGFVGTVAAAIGYDVSFADLEGPALLFARLNSLPFVDRVKEIRRLNWQTDQLGRRYETIVGADILYERKQWDFLEPFWRAHLAPGGRVLLGEPGRQTGDLFGDWILARGWTLVRHEQKVETRERAIRIFELGP